MLPLLPLLAGNLIATTVPATLKPCPEGVINQIDGLYRWHVQRMGKSSDPVEALSSQLQRFTPSLFELLIEARQLHALRDGRFLDIDVFSNTQASTYSAKVTGCSTEKAGSIMAAVDVQAGLRPPGMTSRLRYELNKDSKGNWRINNISYLDGHVFQLRPFLQELVNPAT